MGINYHTVLAPRLNHLRVLGLALQQEAKVVAIHCYLAHLGTANADGLTAGLQTHTMAQKQSKASQSIRFIFFLFVDVISCCRCGGSWSTKSDCILQWLDVVHSHFGSRSGAVTVDGCRAGKMLLSWGEKETLQKDERKTTDRLDLHLRFPHRPTELRPAGNWEGCDM